MQTQDTQPSERPYTVVVGVSPTSKSTYALEWAAAQAAEQNGRLIAVRAWYATTPPSAPSLQGGIPGTAADEAERQLAADVEAVLGPDHGAELRLTRGKARSRALIEASQDADLLVIDAPRTMMVGPMLAHRLVYNAKCPVVTMPPAVASPPSDQPSALARGGKALANSLLKSAGTAGRPGWRPPTSRHQSR